ncbi:FAD-binding oxidoreductase [Asanoa siamensis]|uniref:FAD-linked oxidase n=1 Tax=Asanoa siamensis TaxID=926357 RepID=A0ABQ4CTG1_9ACTN|nr:FAD-binding oxidoreductase [Asanoa siamensis]GIF74565.1 FAD-linked oxidase [Asanoa siamensis]
MSISATTVQGGLTNLSDEIIDELRGRVSCPVLAPEDAGFGEVREVFNAMHPGDPALVVSCSGTADVLDAVGFAREHGLALSVRGGGHSIAGLSASDSCMLIDLAPMHAVHVDPAAKLARVQGGAVWADVDRETQAFGLAAPGGVVSDTGVAGLTLGGGYGWLRRKYGLSCDHLVAAEVIGADGQVTVASEAENTDLLWALRGGGGNFGVVTWFTFALEEVGPTVAFTGVFYPVEEAAQVLRGWRNYVAVAPDEVTATFLTVTMPPDPTLPPVLHNRACALVGGVYSGDAAAGMDILRPLRELGTPLMDMSAPTPYVEVQSGFDAFFPRNTLQAYWKSRYLSSLSDEAIEFVAARAKSRPSPVTLVNVFSMGGAIAAVPPDATAFAQRSSPFLLSIDGNWTDARDNDANIAWVRETFRESAAYGDDGVYLNFTGRSDEPPSVAVDSAFGANLARLAEIKAKYDPTNMFRSNNNITPAGG